MKTVLLVSTEVFHYRVSVYNYLWRRFRENDWEFKVVSNRLQPQNQLPLRFEYREIPFSFASYRRVIKEIKPAAVMFHLRLKDRVFWPLIHWLKLRRIPIIWWTKGANLDKPDSRLNYVLYNYLHGLSDAVLLYSAGQLEFVAPRSRAKVFAANNTVNFEDYPAVRESKEEIKAGLGIPFKKVVLFVGTMGVNGERKKVEHLIQVFRDIDRSDIGLLMVGSGMTDELRAGINPRNSRYLGDVHDPKNLQISKLFKAADIFVVPGHVGLGLNQAFYWGLPAVTEAGRQPPEIQYLKSGHNGFLVPENSLAELKEKILYLLDNDAAREKFSRHAREGILQDASIENMFQSFLKAVEFVLAAKGHRKPARGIQEVAIR